MSFLTRRKPIDGHVEPGHAMLKRSLSWPHLVALGVGAIVGTGIYTLIGVGAGLAGPGVMLAFVLAGLVCVFAALCYAELAAMMPAAGSAYTYSYTALGEFIAWIGWTKTLGLASAVLPELLVRRRVHASNTTRAAGALRDYAAAMHWLMQRRRGQVSP
jgi:APA family basic amino acid/polyamine antiporter